MRVMAQLLLTAGLVAPVVGCNAKHSGDDDDGDSGASSSCLSVCEKAAAANCGERTDSVYDQTSDYCGL